MQNLSDGVIFKVSLKDTGKEVKKMNPKITPKGLRVSAGMTQNEVAEYLGLSTTQYKRKENNKVRFYADEIYKLSKLYDVPINIFFEKKVSLQDTKEG